MLAAAARRADPPATVLAGGFHDGRFAGMGRGRAARRRRSCGSSRASSRSPRCCCRTRRSLGQVLSKSKAAGALVRDLFDKRERLAPTELLPRLLGALCAEGPAVCLVDDADRAPDGLWADLVLGMGGRVASDWPLLLVLALDGPARLGDHDDGEPDSLYVARCLRDDGVADWHPLAPVGLDELERFDRRRDAGRPARAARRDRRARRVGGAAVAPLARERRRRAGRRPRPVLALRPRRPCARGRSGRGRARPPAHDRARRRRHARAARRRASCSSARRSRAAASRPRASPPRCGRDRDEVIDLLDEQLAARRGPSARARRRATARSRSTTRPAAGRCGATASPPSWTGSTLSRHHGLTDARRSERAGELARALRERYGGEAHRIAHALARLFTLAGDLDAARHFARMADNGVSREVILWRAQTVLDAPDPHRPRRPPPRVAAADRGRRPSCSTAGRSRTACASPRPPTASLPCAAIKQRRCG